jgi:hypothetical protein
MNIPRALRAVLRVAVCLHLGSAGIGLAATDWSPATLLTQPFDISVSKIQITPSARWGLFRESDSISIQTTDDSAIQIFDLNGNSVYSGIPTTLTLPRGHYIVECNGDRTQFCVLPDDYAGAPFLGSETDNWSDSSCEQRMAAMGITWVRMVQSLWEDVETNRDAWDWSTVDKAVAANPGRKIIAMSASLVPSWVGPNEIVPLHAAYVQALSTRYKGKLAAIEIWNEPYNGKFPNTTNVDSFVNFYLQIFSQAHQAIKAVDPIPQVIGPAWTAMPQLESLSMATNPLATFDGWSWHDYYRDSFAPDVDYLSPDLVRSITKDHLEWNCGRFADLPSLFVDELGLYGRSALGTDTGTNVDTHLASSLDWHRGMCRAIKTTAMYRAAGISCIIPHVLPLAEDLSNPNFELCGWDVGFRGPHPKTTAFLMTCYWLNGATLVNYLTPGTNVFLYAWQLTNNTSLVIAWALEGQTVPLQTNGLARATDIYGRTNNIIALTEEPVVFRSNDSDPLVLLSAVRSNLVGITNTAPVIDPLPTESVVAGQPLQIIMSATDAEHDPITFSATTLPPGATFDPNTQTFSWTPGAGVSGPYTATFVATDSLGASNSITTTITVLGTLFDGLLSHWRFDESAGTIAADSAGTNDGTLTGFNFTTNSGWVSGKIGNGLSFDGVNDSVSLDGSQINLTNNFTVAAWLYPRNAAGAGAFISVRSIYQSSGFRFFIYNNSVFVQGQTTAGWQGATFDTGTIQNGNWYHVAVVDDNSTILVYVNGVYLGSAYWGGNMVMNSNPFSRIGSDGTEGADYFNGVIDDMMIFARTLTVAQVQALYQSGDQPPVFTPTGSQVVGSGQSLNFTLSASDPDNTNLTYSATSLPSGASLNAATGAFSWTPSVSQTGTYNITFVVSDGILTDSESTAITVSSGSVPNTMRLTSNPTVTNAVIQIDSLAVAVAGETNVFTVSAVDSDGRTLYYVWTFGDGDSSTRFTSSTSSHVYADCGPYTATVTVDDGIYSTNASLTVSIACLLNTSRLQGTLNFARTNADNCTVKGTFALPPNYNFTGKLVTLNIGGAQTSFTLDSKGRGLNGLNRFSKPSYNKITGLWTFNAILRNGSWRTPWAAHGLLNASILKPGVSVTLPVILAIDNESFMATPSRHYTSLAGRSGIAR